MKFRIFFGNNEALRLGMDILVDPDKDRTGLVLSYLVLLRPKSNHRSEDSVGDGGDMS